MAIFITGATGYLGAHVAAALLDRCKESLNLLVRARDEREAELRLWHAFQLHLAFPRRVTVDGTQLNEIDYTQQSAGWPLGGRVRSGTE